MLLIKQLRRVVQSAILILLLWQIVVPAALVNLGYLQFTDILMTAPDLSRSYPGWRRDTQKLQTASVISLFDMALILNHTNRQAQLGKGRAALARGDAKTSAQTLTILENEALVRPLLFLDLVMAYGQANRYDAIDLLSSANIWNDIPPVFFCPDEMDDQAAHQYWHRAKMLQKATEIHPMRAKMQRRARYQPSDLDILYNCWRWAKQNEVFFMADIYRDLIVHFSEDGTRSTSYRLRDGEIQLVPTLLEEGLWDRQQSLNVASFITWQQYEAATSEHMLKALASRYPEELDWQFLLAELYHRRDELEQAQHSYLHILAQDSKYAEAYLRLGTISEARYHKSSDQESLREAFKWYQQYQQLAPDDLFGLKKQSEVATAINSPEATVLEKQLHERTNLQNIVADLLGLQAKDVRLGDNLIVNSDFEQWNHEKWPTAWRVTDYARGGPFNRGFFINGEDPLISWEASSARINGLWLEYNKKIALGSSGFSPRKDSNGALLILPPSASPYVLSFYYRTMQSGLNIWISPSDRLLFAGNHSLLPTYGSWRRFILVGWNRTGNESAIEPIVRSFGVGSIWIDNFQLQSISCVNGNCADTGEVLYNQ